MRSISLNAAISVAVCFIPTAALADDPFAQVNHGFSVKARFLSSEQPAGGFWVVNKSPHDVYVRLGSFHVQMWSGRAWVDDPASGSYQRPEQEQRMEPRISEVSAAEFLPRCTATSEPCVQYVRATYAIRVGSVVRNFATPVQRYDVVADATATFDLWSSMDDRPTFLTISGSGKPDVLVLHYTLGTAGELLPGGVLTSELLDEFRRFGVLVTRDRMDDATTFRIAGAPNQAEHVRDATTAIAAEYGSYFRSVETYFAIDSSRLQRQDLVDADATASRYAKLVGSEQPGGTAIWPPQQPIRLFPTQTAGADPFAGALQRTLTAAHDSIAVLNPYTAAGHARLDLDAGVRAAASRLAEPAHVEGVVLPRIPIEGDRAEIYGIASVQNEAALHAGVSPEGAAIVQADARVHALATALGAAPGELSLLTQLPTDADRTAIGVARTFDGQVNPSPLAPTSGASAAVVADGEAAAVPILVLEPDKVLATRGTATLRRAPNALQLDVELTSGEGPMSAATRVTDEVARAVAQIPHVLRATATPAAEQIDADFGGYRILIAPSSAATVRAVIAAIEKHYAVESPVLSASILGLINDCNGLESRLIESAAHAAERTAIARKPLRKLVLAAALPMRTTDGYCFGTSAGANDVHALRVVTPGEIPSVPSAVTLTLDVALTFRTF